MNHTALKLILSEEFPVIPHPAQVLWRVNGKNELDKTMLCRLLAGNQECVTAVA
jgi:hypothetical protein